MRVLLTTDPVGGVWTFTKELVTELLARGHAVGMISFGRKPSASQSAWCISIGDTYRESFRYTACNAPLEWMTSNESAYSSALPALLDFAQAFGPDLVHSGQFCFGSLPLGVPTVVTAHSDVLSWADCCKPEGLAPSVWLDQYRSLVQRGLDAAAAVVAPTACALDTLSRHFALGSKGQVIHNGRSVPTCKVKEPRRVQAISAGRFWDPAKHLRLLAEVKSSMPILIAGDQQYEDSRAVDDLSRIRSLGLLDESELLSAFRSSSVYVVPSIYEPFGLAPLEAGLCGCAVIANDISSLREVWGDHALYFRGPVELSKLLDHLHQDPDHLLKARERSFDRARELTAAKMTDRYLALYQYVLHAKASPTSQETVVYA